MASKNTKTNNKSYDKALYEHFLKVKDTAYFANIFANGITENAIKTIINHRKEDIVRQMERDLSIISNFEENAKIVHNPYKAFVNFLKNKTNKLGSEESANLLAVMLDYHPRPKVAYLKIGERNKTFDEIIETQFRVNQDKQTKLLQRISMIMLIMLALLIIFFIVYFVNNR